MFLYFPKFAAASTASTRNCITTKSILVALLCRCFCHAASLHVPRLKLGFATQRAHPPELNYPT